MLCAPLVHLLDLNSPRVRPLRAAGVPNSGIYFFQMAYV